MSKKRLFLVTVTVIGICFNPLPVLAQDFGFFDWFYEAEDYYEEEYNFYGGGYEPYDVYGYGGSFLPPMIVLGFSCR